MAKPNRTYNKDFWMFKAPMSLKDKLDMVRRERIKRDKDKSLQTYSRLALAISRHDKLLKDLIDADLPEENKR